MSEYPDVVALIPAAGSGTRLGLGPKALLELSSRALVEWAVASVAHVCSRVRVAVAVDDVAAAEARLTGTAEVCAGGRTRAETIRLLLANTTEPFVLVHDAARPFASRALVSRVVLSAKEHGAAISVSSARSAAVRRTTSVSGGANDMAADVWSRAAAGLGETPFCLRRDLLDGALLRLEQSREDRSPWEVLVEEGVQVCLVSGEETNMKITTPLDWQIAQRVIAPSLDGLRWD